jgi:small subunit ribosomal protein S16
MRLQRRGKKNYATFRVVIADGHAPIQGKFIADLGYWNPHSDTFVIKKDDVQKWIQNGAQPSATVHNLLVGNKIIKGEKVKSWRPKKKQGEPQQEQQPS